MSNVVNKLIFNCLVQYGNVALPQVGSLQVVGSPKQVTFSTKISDNHIPVTDIIAEQGALSDEQAAWYKEQTRFIEPKATSEIAKDYATFTNAMAEASLFWKQAEVQDVLKGLYGAETQLTWQQIRESKAKEFMYSAQGTLAYGQNVQETEELLVHVYEQLGCFPCPFFIKEYHPGEHPALVFSAKHGIKTRSM